MTVSEGDGEGNPGTNVLLFMLFMAAVMGWGARHKDSAPSSVEPTAVYVVRLVEGPQGRCEHAFADTLLNAERLSVGSEEPRILLDAHRPALRTGIRGSSWERLDLRRFRDRHRDFRVYVVPLSTAAPPPEARKVGDVSDVSHREAVRKLIEDRGRQGA